jgi:hypothetical protein
LIDQSVIFASTGRVARIVAVKRVAASPKFSGSQTIVFQWKLTASVDDRAAQTFGDSSFPSEIGDHES